MTIVCTVAQSGNYGVHRFGTEMGEEGDIHRRMHTAEWFIALKVCAAQRLDSTEHAGSLYVYRVLEWSSSGIFFGITMITVREHILAIMKSVLRFQQRAKGDPHRTKGVSNGNGAR